MIIFVFSFCQNVKEAKTIKAEDIRESAVSGMFYPANAMDLKSMVKEYLAKASVVKLPKGENIFGLIAPHAGYIYSGQVAGWAFKQVEGRSYDTVLIFGVGHRYPLRKPSVFKKGYYKTPLGLVPVDEELTKAILKDNLFQSVDEAHKLEHSIEVQLPFLQLALKNDFKIVPILFSHFSFDMVDKISSVLYKIMKTQKDKNILIVASSDLSHYPSYQEGEKVDKATIELIQSLKIKKLIQREEKIKDSGVANLVTYQCGLGAVTTLMLLAREAGASTVNLIQYKNSGDTSWVKERIVGYAAMSFSGKDVPYNEKKSGFYLTEEEKKLLLQMARKTLTEFIKKGKTPSFEIKSDTLKKNAGAFVTLNKDHQLRGCIGYILPVKSLSQTVIENTVNACSHDFRFPTVTASELDKIEIEISVLSPPEPVSSYKDIVLGKHGIILKKGMNQSVFLPQVAPEQGWDLSTTLTHLSMKAGLGPQDWKSGCEFQVFTAIVFKESDFK